MIDTLYQDSQEFLGNEFSKDVKKKEQEGSYCNLSLSLSVSKICDKVFILFEKER